MYKYRRDRRTLFILKMCVIGVIITKRKCHQMSNMLLWIKHFVIFWLVINVNREKIWMEKTLISLFGSRREFECAQNITAFGVCAFHGKRLQTFYMKNGRKKCVNDVKKERRIRKRRGDKKPFTHSRNRGKAIPNGLLNFNNGTLGFASFSLIVDTPHI